MSDDKSQEKTEEPTPKRLKDAKEKGDVARSKDLNTLVILLFSSVGFLFFGQMIIKSLLQLMRDAFTFNQEVLTTPSDMLYFVTDLAMSSFVVVFPFLLLLMLAAIIGPLLLGGWSFSAKGLMPKFERISPLKGIKRIFAVRGLVEMVKSFGKFLVVATVAISVLYNQIDVFLSLGNFPLKIALSKAASILVWSFLLVSSGLIIIAGIDIPYQLWEHFRKLKMTFQEIKDEYKETEGKPEVKSQIRKAQHDIAKRRMMHEVPKADVILTNPTHYAVAISYHDGLGEAPKVLAKGKDLVAMQINTVAKAHEIPIFSLPPLARAIYFTTDLNQEIPRGLYVAVAQVLAYVFQLRSKGDKDFQDYANYLNNLTIPSEYQFDA